MQCLIVEHISCDDTWLNTPHYNQPRNFHGVLEITNELGCVTFRISAGCILPAITLDRDYVSSRLQAITQHLGVFRVCSNDDFIEYDIFISHEVLNSVRSQLRLGPKITTISTQQFYDKIAPLDDSVKVFAKQEHAFNYYDSLHDQHLIKLFTFEAPHDGTRRFLVAHFEVFLSRYISLAAPHRHVYEIIRDKCPCRLYFDVEFSIAENPNLDGDELLALWLHLVSHHVLLRFRVLIKPDNIICLDATTSVKYSRHVIIILSSDDGREYLFENNVQQGHFVESIFLSLLVPREEVPESQHICMPYKFQLLQPRSEYRCLFVSCGSETMTCFVDSSVYSRNRAFRLLLSTKYGKEAPFQLHRRTKHFIMSHINGVIFNTIGKSSRVRAAISESLRKSFVVPVEVLGSSAPRDKFIPLEWLNPDPDTSSTGGYRSVTSSTHHYIKTDANTVLHSTHTGEETPFPDLDQFIISLMHQTGPGIIGKWIWRCFPNDSAPLHTIVYHLLGNRYCHRIKRHHKSNQVMYEVNINSGVVHQKCWDPDCRGYRSSSICIPAEVLPEMSRVIDISLDIAIAKAEFDTSGVM